jgi:acetoin utilization protein AcuC
MDPTRLALTMALVRAFGVDRAPAVHVAAAPAAGDSTLRLVHEPEYIAAVRAGRPDEERGLGTEDNPVFPGMHEAAALIAGQSVAAAEAVWPLPGTPRDRPAPLHAVNFAGGLHHAMPGRASGFCVYNDPALAIARLLELGVERVAYVDVDVHHGDGVQYAFWDDPRVLTVSLHEHPRTLFPQTGWPQETGGEGAEGSAVNVALPAGTGDAGWLRAFHAVVPELLAAFRPQVLVSQHGADTHIEDPLAHLAVTVDAQRAVAESLHRLAHEHAGGRWVALGGGGYAVPDVVPRTWTHLVAVAAGHPLDPAAQTPDEWRAEVYRETRRMAPLRMTDGAVPAWKDFAEAGYDPADRVDQAILATRRVVFPLHGLLP